MKKNVQERRVFRRFDLGGEVSLKSKNGDGESLSAYLGDMGLGGFCIETKEEMDLDKDVEFLVKTGSVDRPLMGTGRIRHIVDRDYFYRVGIQFTQVNENKVRHVIKNTLGWRKKHLLPRYLRREIVFSLKVLPIIAAISYIVLTFSTKAHENNIKEREYRERFKEAMIHYLYNG
ncbi:MAG: PilZ domain-containing protein [Candidatus Omnitrophota bacterium]